MTKDLLADIINDVSAIIGWNRLAYEKAGRGHVRECRERQEWIDKTARQLLERLGMTYGQIEEIREPISLSLEEDLWRE